MWLIGFMASVPKSVLGWFGRALSAGPVGIGAGEPALSLWSSIMMKSEKVRTHPTGHGGLNIAASAESK